jgi:hypothetical protein
VRNKVIFEGPGAGCGVEVEVDVDVGFRLLEGGIRRLLVLAWDELLVEDDIL